MDWLQSIGDMQVHWGRKLLSFRHHGRKVQLHGVSASTASCAEITVHQLEALDKMDSICHLVHFSDIKDTVSEQPCPAPIQVLLTKFGSLFDEQQGLPPCRVFDYRIQLLHGSHPVNLRPYQYNSEQKTEMERQIAEMLHQGIIRSSTSPFSSLVLLVQKKDGT
jgi:hypothetical protein